MKKYKLKNRKIWLMHDSCFSISTPFATYMSAHEDMRKKIKESINNGYYIEQRTNLFVRLIKYQILPNGLLKKHFRTITLMQRTIE